MLQEGMFDHESPCWFGFIEATTDMNSSWKMMECPTVHLFAFAISWVLAFRHEFHVDHTDSPIHLSSL
jgi:hypothetical protein